MAVHFMMPTSPSVPCSTCHKPPILHLKHPISLLISCLHWSRSFRPSKALSYKPAGSNALSASEVVQLNHVEWIELERRGGNSSWTHSMAQQGWRLAFFHHLSLHQFLFTFCARQTCMLSLLRCKGSHAAAAVEAPGLEPSSAWSRPMMKLASCATGCSCAPGTLSRG